MRKETSLACSLYNLARRVTRKIRRGDAEERRGEGRKTTRRWGDGATRRRKEGNEIRHCSVAPSPRRPIAPSSSHRVAAPSTSRTLRAKASGINGFCRKAESGAITP